MTLSPLTNERISTKLEPNVALRSQTADWFNENRSPIHMACIYGDLKAVQQLVKKDSNTDLINIQDGLHDTPLELAARYGSTEIVRLLLTCEHVTVSYPAPTPADMGWPANAVAMGIPLPTARYNAMYWAARHGHVDIVSMLLDDCPGMEFMHSNQQYISMERPLQYIQILNVAYMHPCLVK